jgi:hypothetical protein
MPQLDLSLDSSSLVKAFGYWQQFRGIARTLTFGPPVETQVINLVTYCCNFVLET